MLSLYWIASGGQSSALFRFPPSAAGAGCLARGSGVKLQRGRPSALVALQSEKNPKKTKKHFFSIFFRAEFGASEIGSPARRAGLFEGNRSLPFPLKMRVGFN
jgi:hypothetical protein